MIPKRANDLLMEWTIKLEEQAAKDQFLMQLQLPFTRCSDSEHKERLQAMLGRMMDREHKATKELREQQHTFRDMQSDRDKGLQALRQMTAEKEKMELELFEKFAHVLNEKKTLIAKLQQRQTALEKELEQLRQAQPTQVKREDISPKPSKRSRTQEHHDDEDEVNRNNRNGGDDDDDEEEDHGSKSDDVERADSSEKSDKSPVASPAKPVQRKRVRQVAAAPAPPPPPAKVAAVVPSSARGAAKAVKATPASIGASAKPSAPSSSPGKASSAKGGESAVIDALDMINGFE
jgi:hypothetical protein